MSGYVPRRSLAILIVLVLMVGAACIFFTNSQTGPLRAVITRQDAQGRLVTAEVRKLQTAVLASCAFAADLGTVPLPSRPKPSRLGVKLVADSREQWRKLACPGQLPVPPGFAHWAAVYHLPAS